MPMIPIKSLGGAPPLFARRKHEYVLEADQDLGLPADIQDLARMAAGAGVRELLVELAQGRASVAYVWEHARSRSSDHWIGEEAAFLARSVQRDYGQHLGHTQAGRFGSFVMADGEPFAVQGAALASGDLQLLRFTFQSMAGQDVGMGVGVARGKNLEKLMDVSMRREWLRPLSEARLIAQAAGPAAPSAAPAPRL